MRPADEISREAATCDKDHAAPEKRGAAGARVRSRVRVEGIVQGVGFRPFVYSLAQRRGLRGFVANDTGGVAIEVEGRREDVAAFLRQLEDDPPPLARIEGIQQEWLPVGGGENFAIVPSRKTCEPAVAVSPDIATCDDCLREMFDPGDRRWQYAFTNCTNCGPRFTIVEDVPYDRGTTTMAGFAMCAECAREYHDPNDRRFHAEPISCPSCGPRLWLCGRDGREMPGDPIGETARLLTAGAVVAIKGLGGYHLAALASHATSVALLRARKHREDKPFAVLVPDLAAAAALAEIGPDEARILAGARRPIVLCRRRPAAPLADAVAPGNRFVGVMLPYTPVHHLLSRRLGKSCVLTSGNVSDEPIAYQDDDARVRLAGIADFFLMHDRRIHMRTDDSVMRVTANGEMVVRRARGYAPQPLLLPSAAPRSILACGAELKSTFCLVAGRHAFLSPHIGDLENFETLRAYTQSIGHFCRLFGVAPQLVAHDLHPEYLSTKHALAMEGVERCAVQHHHAHVAACLADNGLQGPALGVAFDGLGYGSDATLWGGEFLLADLVDFERVGHLEAVRMPGGVQALREPWRMAAAYVQRTWGEHAPADLDVMQRNHVRWPMVTRLAQSGLQSPVTSSAGRLFDAVASLLSIRDKTNYEGQAAVELEQLADRDEAGAYPIGVSDSVPHVLFTGDLIRAVVEDLAAGVPDEIIAARFHNALAAAVLRVARIIRRARGIEIVALTGGVFQNQLLLERTVERLVAAKFRVVNHHRVPTNDGGISFGQAMIAAARCLKREDENPQTRANAPVGDQKEDTECAP